MYYEKDLRDIVSKLPGHKPERGEEPMDQVYTNRTILMVDDDPDDFFLAREALKDNGLPIDFQLLSDGEELMDYLHRRGRFTSLGNLKA